MDDKEGVWKYLTKEDLLASIDKGRFKEIKPEVLETMKDCNRNDVIGIRVTTGSFLVAHEAVKIDEKKFIELVSG